MAVDYINMINKMAAAGKHIKASFCLICRKMVTL